MTRKLVAVGPSLVDISMTLSNRHFDRFCRAYGVRAGEWREIATAEVFEELLAELGVDFAALIAAPQPHAALIAGSSTLSMLAALEPAVRRDATYASLLASQAGEPTSVAGFFAREVRAMGLRHFSPLREGVNPVGLVIAATDDPEKVLLFHPGVSRSSEGMDLAALAPDLLIIDAYELQQGDLAEMLHGLIASGRFRIALSLGNHVILAGDTLRRILDHVRASRIFAIAGNLFEYRAMMPDVPVAYLTRSGFRDHPIRRFVPFSLLTMGEEGMAANWRGVSAVTDAVPVPSAHIVNTSGAGDAAAGIFFAGAIDEQPVAETLVRAARVAGRVLQVPGSLVLG